MNCIIHLHFSQKYIIQRLMVDCLKPPYLYSVLAVLSSSSLAIKIPHLLLNLFNIFNSVWKKDEVCLVLEIIWPHIIRNHSSSLAIISLILD